MTNGTEEKPAVQNSDKRKVILIATFAIFCIIVIVVCLSMTLYIVTKKPAEPKTLIIYADESDPAICAVTREDLEKAIEISRGWAVNSFKGKPDTGSEQLNELGDMIAAGRIGRINSQTRCVLLESRRGMCKVRIIEGPMNGMDYWVHKNSIGPAGMKEYPQGVIWALLCFRYVITALICASVLYFLRVKSILTMLVGFIIGMLILNLLWLKIASALMFH
jgi:hypothetical protein